MLGRTLLVAAGGLKPLLDTPRGRDIGAVAWCRLLAALELGRRYLDAEMKSCDRAERSRRERAAISSRGSAATRTRYSRASFSTTATA